MQQGFKDCRILADAPRGGRWRSCRRECIPPRRKVLFDPLLEPPERRAAPPSLSAAGCDRLLPPLLQQLHQRSVGAAHGRCLAPSIAGGGRLRLVGVLGASGRVVAGHGGVWQPPGLGSSAPRPLFPLFPPHSGPLSTLAGGSGRHQRRHRALPGARRPRWGTPRSCRRQRRPGRPALRPGSALSSALGRVAGGHVQVCVGGRVHEPRAPSAILRVGWPGPSGGPRTCWDL